MAFHTVQLYKEAGVPGQAFTGVPIFQAQGLTVKTENSRYTPLFLAKEDLDVAVGAAFSQREAAKEVANKSKASAAEEEVASARAAVSGPLQNLLLCCISVTHITCSVNEALLVLGLTDLHADVLVYPMKHGLGRSWKLARDRPVWCTAGDFREGQAAEGGAGRA